MAAAVITVARPSGIRGCMVGNKKLTFRDVTADTGDYAQGGFTVTAAQLGLRHIDMVWPDGVTEGTSGANSQVLGITYASSGASITVQIYEAAASGAPPLEKTAEAYPANFRFRLAAIGY